MSQKIVSYDGKAPELLQQTGVDVNRVLSIMEKQMEVLRELSSTVIIVPAGTYMVDRTPPEKEKDGA